MLIAAGLTAAAATVAVGDARAPGGGDATGTRRGVALVANAFDGTVDLIDQRSLRRIGRIDVAPDYRRCVAAGGAAGAFGSCVVDNELAARGVLILVDDLRVSPDGRMLYVSRPSLGDVAAFSLRTERRLWRLDVPGRYADHLALSPDGTRLVVSDRGLDVVHEVDTASVSITDRFATGDTPHGNEYSEDGERVYNGSMGQGMAPAAECGCWLTIADADTLDVRRVIEFDQGVRPFVVMPNGGRAYIQLTHLPGFVEYDLRRERPLRTMRLPVPDQSTLLEPDSSPPAATHHGIAVDGDRRTICAAATISDYAAIVRRRSLSVKGIVHVGDEPAWASWSGDGRYCFVANRDSDDVSVVSLRRPREVARIDVGDHPVRIRMARVRLR